MKDQLPIESALPALLDALKSQSCAVLEAPPGAGKTTRVPLAILESGLCEGRIVMLEPRRLAARAAAYRMADVLGSKVGALVGYRMRGDTKVSAATRIEVVTEGVLTRMIQSDPTLEGVSALIFDEFHERSLNADLGLALCLEVREALRADLMLLIMSATLDGAEVAALLDGAPVVRSEGRSYDVETQWLTRPLAGGIRFEAAVTRLIEEALEETEGGILVFLPGEREIRRVETALKSRLPTGCVLRPLYGAMPFADQTAAIRPEASSRKVVLATSIAETSLTIEDIRVVIDSGRARRARFDPGSGMSRLVTERVTRAEADQRRGRAGRIASGVCYRLWTKGEEGGMAPYPPAEIEAADLSRLALDLALWGARDAADLAFLTPAPKGPLAAAQRLLVDLGAIDEDNAITNHGRDLAALSLHPRLAHMLVLSGKGAASLAALLADRDPVRNGGADLTVRLDALAGRHVPGADGASLDRVRAEAKRLARAAGPDKGLSRAEQASLAFPDRIGLRRSGDVPRWVLSGGKGVYLDPNDGLANTPLIVVTDTDGNPQEARIRQAVALSEAELRRVHGEQIGWHKICAWSRREARVVARQQERFGALVLSEQIWHDASPEDVSRAMLDGVRDIGLHLPPAAERLVARAELVRSGGSALPDMSIDGLMSDLENWLFPFLTGVQTAADWKRFDPSEALKARLGWVGTQTIDREAPAHYTTPLGRKVAIDYSSGAPEIAVRLQEMFGITVHPTVAGHKLRVTLLSPAGRPLQTTNDLPGFWASSYADVRRDMRGRYPKHPWPENPANADPTLRAKPKGK